MQANQFVDRTFRFTVEDAKKLDNHLNFELVTRQLNAKYNPFIKTKMVNTATVKDMVKPDELRKMLSKILPSKKGMKGITDELKNLTISVTDIAKSLNITKICSFVNIGLSCVNMAVSIAGFMMVSNQLNALNVEVQKVLQTVENIANAQKNNRLSEYQKLIMRFNSMSSKLGRRESVSLDEMETLIIDMRAYISEMIMNLKDRAMGTELVLKVINALVPAYTQLLREFLMRFYFEKGQLPANYEMFVDLYNEMNSEDYQRIIIDYLFLDEGRNNVETFDLSNVQTLIGLNYRVQIEDQAELLMTLGSKEAMEEFDQKLDEYVKSSVEESAAELATDS